MLQMTLTRVLDSIERPVAAAATITAEGQPLVADYTGGIFGVKPAAGTANETFMGVSRAQQLTPLSAAHAETQTVGSSLVVTLAHIPTSFSFLRIRDITAGADLAVNSTGPVSAVLAVLTTGTAIVTVHSTQLAHVLEFIYRYVPTAADALNLQGNIPAGGAASLILQSVECIAIGDIYTSEYDPLADYTDESKTICTKVGGLFTNATPAGGLVAVPDAIVISVPSTDSPYLGLRLSA